MSSDFCCLQCLRGVKPLKDEARVWGIANKYFPSCQFPLKLKFSQVLYLELLNLTIFLRRVFLVAEIIHALDTKYSFRLENAPCCFQYVMIRYFLVLY